MVRIQQRISKYNIKYINYSTLSEYFKELKSELLNKNLKLNQVEQDFLPYNTGSDEYWSGYYTTRPTIKKQIRDYENELNQVRNLLSLTQHHDIVTGTSRSYVLNDYFLKLKESRLLSLNLISILFNFILSNNQQQQKVVPTNNENNYSFNNIIDLKKLNENEFYLIKLFNSLGWESNQHLSIRLKSNSTKQLKNLKLYDENLKLLKIQINSLDYSNDCFKDNNQFTLFTFVKVQALSFKTLLLSIKQDDGGNNNLIIGENFNKLKSDIIFKNEQLSMEWIFSKNNGLLNQIKQGEKEIKEKQILKIINQKLGPYIFEAVSQLSMVYSSKNCEKLSIINQRIYKSPNGDIYNEIQSNSLETSYSFIGEMNREKVIQYEIDSIDKNNKEFYTDNGIESRKKIINKDGSISSNYYPTLHYTHLKNELSNKQFSIFVDRSVGCTSKSNNNLEFMLHRTMDYDDSKGISCPSKDKSRIDGKIYFNFDSIKNQKENQKKLSLQLDYQPFYLIKKVENLSNYQNQFKQLYSPFLLKDLPNNIHLLSLNKLYNDNNEIGLRIFNLNNNKEIIIRI